MAAIDPQRPVARTSAKRRFRAPLVWAAGGWLILMVVVSIFATWLMPFDFMAMDLRNRLGAPVFQGGEWSHPLGSDHLGRDILSRLIIATRVSILIALFGTLIGAVVGVTLGFIAAHFRGWVDEVIMVLVDFQASMPFMIIALAILAFFGNSFALFLVIVGLQGWERYTRITRGLTLSAMTRGYAVAVSTVGGRPAYIYARHILPNIGSALVVQMTLNFPETILLETSLSFLGLGIQPPMVSLGSMLGYGRDYLLNAWWIAVSPGVLIFLTTLAMSILGDWVRDRLDPTLQPSE
jgi:peptide/nickel transport system permease protein